MRFLTVENVIDLHRDMMEWLRLEPQPLVHPDYLESALQRLLTRAHYLGETDPFTLAALFGVAIAKVHAFSDGNKRTAYQAMFSFLDLNGYDLSDDELILARLIVQAVAGGADTSAAEVEIARYLRMNSEASDEA